MDIVPPSVMQQIKTQNTPIKMEELGRTVKLCTYKLPNLAGKVNNILPV
jgi:hypothetical protein